VFQLVAHRMGLRGLVTCVIAFAAMSGPVAALEAKLRGPLSGDIRMLDEIELQLRGLTERQEAAGGAELYQLALQTVLIETDLSLLSGTLSTQLRTHKAALDNLGRPPRFGGRLSPKLSRRLARGKRKWVAISTVFVRVSSIKVRAQLDF
jgi:hypothetical protein